MITAPTISREPVGISARPGRCGLGRESGMRRRGLRTPAMAWALVGLALVGAPSRGGEIYYGMIFGSQPEPKRLKYTHTWATFIKVVGEGTDPRGYALEYNTISWLPRTLEVKVLRPWAEPGVNLDLYQTLDAM